MKILYIVPNINNEGGVARVLAVKSNYLINKLGYQVTILTQNKGNSPLFYEFHKDISLIDISLNGSVVNFLKSYKLQLQNSIQTIKPDVIIICDNGLKAFLLPFILKTKIPVILEIHSSKFVKEENSNALSYNLKQKITTLVKTFGIKKYKNVVVETSGSIDEWKLKNGIVIPNPLWFSTDKKSDLSSKKVIAVGRHVHEKGFDRLLKIWKKTIENHPNWILDIYGSSDSENSLRKLTAALQISKNVNFFEPTISITDKYLEASIYLMTSRFEGFGMVLIEAMACGLPVIAFDCPVGPKAIISNNRNGFLIENGKEDDYIKKLNLLINDSNLRVKMGLIAKESSSKYDIDFVMNQWQNLFQSLK
ncbi:glycosyltransferase family 4 protein [Flavobacterium sp. SUN052]|uniref:glycosyltransferase family 4 protein n=1 Tax=Flavobacterium sp. SUN052 TaxID=3002441 RepID=UPI00237E2C3F|nr:glycosyltransferase family 4 protein [Flavobacterium sp. SUN052]MEC4005412.1 glycosyltransferase family 4 protein [Flavobacterium sp. SUN052]